jgi:phage FluMu protein Com
MPPSQKGKLDLKLIRCPLCNKGLFKMSPAFTFFYVVMPCPRCSNRRGAPVYVTVYISLETPVAPVVDSNAENLASA